MFSDLRAKPSYKPGVGERGLLFSPEPLSCAVYQTVAARNVIPEGTTTIVDSPFPNGFGGDSGSRESTVSITRNVPWGIKAQVHPPDRGESPDLVMRRGGTVEFVDCSGTL